MAKPVSQQQITQLLKAWNLGDEAALNDAIPLVYDELRRLAHSYMLRERPDHLLQTTALINEAYLRFSELQDFEWRDRNQFIAIAACLMRRILVEFARTRDAKKRGGGQRQLTLNEEFLEGRGYLDYDLIALDEALTALGELDARKAQVVELRFFAGLSVRETAESMELSEETVMRDWRFAKAWLRNKLCG